MGRNQSSSIYYATTIHPPNSTLSVARYSFIYLNEFAQESSEPVYTHTRIRARVHAHTHTHLALYWIQSNQLIASYSSQLTTVRVQLCSQSNVKLSNT